MAKRTDRAPRVHKPRTPLPTPLPDDEGSRALWIGYEASRWLPFDPELFLRRAAALKAPVLLGNDGKGVWYMMPNRRTAEFDFITGWHNGFDGAARKVAKVLRQNKELAKLHIHLSKTAGIINRRKPATA